MRPASALSANWWLSLLYAQRDQGSRGVLVAGAQSRRRCCTSAGDQFARSRDRQANGCEDARIRIAAGLATSGSLPQCCEHALLSKRAVKAVRGFLKIYDQICELAHGPLLDLLETTIELTRYREHLAKQTQASEGEDSDVLANLDELLAEAQEIGRRFGSPSWTRG